MEVKRELPPNYEEICKTLSPNDKTVFTYGQTLYVPHIPEDMELPPDLMVHEEIHAKQQTNPVEWWNKYLSDQDFRFSQELEAYAAQWNYVNNLEVKRAGKEKFLDMIARDLSGEMYGNLFSHGEAQSKIRSSAKHLDPLKYVVS